MTGRNQSVTAVVPRAASDPDALGVRAYGPRQLRDSCPGPGHEFEWRQSGRQGLLNGTSGFHTVQRLRTRCTDPPHAGQAAGMRNTCPG